MCVQVKNERTISAMENSCSVTTSEHIPLSESRYTAMKAVFNRRRKKTSVRGADVTHQRAVNSVHLSPHVTGTGSARLRLNRSLPVQSCSRAYSEDGTPVGSTRLQRGRPNSVKCGLSSPLHRSLMVSAGTSLPAACAAVIDTSPIHSTHSVTSAVPGSSNRYVCTVTNGTDGSSLVRSESKVSLNAPMEMTLDDSTHNQAFTESMLVDADESCTDAVDCDKEGIICHDISQLSSPCLPPSSLAQLFSPSVADPALKPIQSSTVSLDSAVDAGNESHVETELNIPRSLSKQSIISHDSGVGLAEPHPSTYHSADTDNQLSPTSDFTRFRRSVGVRSSLCRQSVRFSPNLQVSSDVRNLLSKAGVSLDVEKENVDKGASDVKLQCRDSMSECEHALERIASPLSSSATVSHHQSKLMPVLPLSTNLLRIAGEQYSVSSKRCISNSAAVAVASPAVSAGPPRIKSALLTPSFKQCLTGVDGTSQLRNRFRGKQVKRLQSSPYRNHSPVNPLSPRHVTTSGHTTVAVPFDLDV